MTPVDQELTESEVKAALHADGALHRDAFPLLRFSEVRGNPLNCFFHRSKLVRQIFAQENFKFFRLLTGRVWNT